MTKYTVRKKTLDQITSVLTAKGLGTLKPPCKWLESKGLPTTRHIANLRETEAQELLAWLDQFPDDQSAEHPGEKETGPPAPEDEPTDTEPTADPAGNESTGGETEAQNQAAGEDAPAETEPAQEPEEGNGEGEPKEQIRKSEDYILVKRPLSPAELEGSLEELYKLAGSRASAEIALDNYKSAAKSCQKTIDALDIETYRLLREMKENEVEEKVAALRVTNLTTGMISWFHQDTGELLREQAIEPGKPLPLDLSGDANNPAAEPAGEPEAAQVERSCDNCIGCDYVEPSCDSCHDCYHSPRGSCYECNDYSEWRPRACENCAHRELEAGANDICPTCGENGECLAWKPRPADEPQAAASEENGPAEVERSCHNCEHQSLGGAFCSDCKKLANEKDQLPNWKFVQHPEVDCSTCAHGPQDDKDTCADCNFWGLDEDHSDGDPRSYPRWEPLPAAETESPHDVSQDVINP